MGAVRVCPAVTTFTPSAGHRAEEWSFATSCFYNNVFFLWIRKPRLPCRPEQHDTVGDP